MNGMNTHEESIKIVTIFFNSRWPLAPHIRKMTPRWQSAARAFTMPHRFPAQLLQEKSGDAYGIPA
jgi:hypothetical protein